MEDQKIRNTWDIPPIRNLAKWFTKGEIQELFERLDCLGLSGEDRIQQFIMLLKARPSSLKNPNELIGFYACLQIKIREMLEVPSYKIIKN